MTTKIAMTELESNLNRILEHIRDSRCSFSGAFVERREEIERHAQKAKEAFDWLDNFAQIGEPYKPSDDSLEYHTSFAE